MCVVLCCGWVFIKKNETMSKKITVENVGSVIKRVIIPAYMGTPRVKTRHLVRRIQRGRVAVREEALYHLTLICADLCATGSRGLAILAELFPPGQKRTRALEEHGCEFVQKVFVRSHRRPRFPNGWRPTCHCTSVTPATAAACYATRYRMRSGLFVPCPPPSLPAPLTD